MKYQQNHQWINFTTNKQTSQQHYLNLTENYEYSTLFQNEQRQKWIVTNIYYKSYAAVQNKYITIEQQGYPRNQIVSDRQQHFKYQTQENNNKFIKIFKKYQMSQNYIVQLLLKSQVKIISLSISLNEYCLERNTLQKILSWETDIKPKLDLNNKKIQYDISNIENPKSIYGIIVFSLISRLQKNIKPYTIILCDQYIYQNGSFLEQLILEFCSKLNNQIYSLIKNNIKFHNTITYISNVKIQNKNRYRSKLQISTFPRFLIIENVKDENLRNFFQLYNKYFFKQINKISIDFVDNILDVQLMFFQLFHFISLIFGLTGMLYGYDFIYQAIDNQSLMSLFQYIFDNEIKPIYKDQINQDLYKNIILQQLHQKKTHIQEICKNPSYRISNYVLQNFQKSIQQNIPCFGYLIIISLWIVYLRGFADNGDSFVVIDEYSYLSNYLFQNNIKQIIIESNILPQYQNNGYLTKRIQQYVNNFQLFGIDQCVSSFLQKVIQDLKL